MPKRTPRTYLLLSLVLLPMFEKRSLKVDVCALGLLALTIFIVVALCTYHKTDPPSSLIFPPADTIHNACGRSGAYTAHFLFESLGLGAYYLAGSLTVLTLVLLARREVDQPVLRAGGWAISLVGLATLAALAVPNLSPGPVIGAGGYIGAMGRHLLEQHFARAGAYIFALTVLLAGLLLCTDYVLVKLAAVTTIFSGRRLAQLGRIGPAVVHRSKRPATDVDDGIDLDDDEADEDQWEDDEQDDEYEYEEDDDGYEYEYETEDDEEAEPAQRDIKVRTPAARSEAADAQAEKPPAVECGSDDGQKAPAGPLASGLKSALGIKNKRADQPHPQPRKSEREEIIEKLEAADQGGCDEVNYELPPVNLLLPADDVSYEEHEREVRRKAKVLEKTFRNFGLNVRVVEIETGPVIAQYEVQLEAGLRLSRITSLADDLAIALRVPSVRIVAPIPGKNTVGIEVPNENRQIVRLREVIEETNGRAKRMKIPIYLGKDVAGNPLIVDLATLPHLLIAGRTGTGKSVCLNSIIVSLLMSRGPDEVRMLMVDPKMVELSGYQKLPHLMHPVVTDMCKAEAILAWAVDKMEERYQLLARAGVRHVSIYNQLGDDELRERIRPRSEIEWEQIPRQLPFIVIVADEMADLMMTAGKDVEQHIIRLAQKSRAVGIHLILATQKPTVDVITGLIKSNLPARIAFQVASRTDSRVVLDEMGAEKLLGNGDMLFLSPGTSMLLRGQGTYLSDDEIVRVVDFVGTDDPQFAHELLELKTKDEKEAASAADFKSRDELYEAAVDIVVRERRGSVSLLQRALGIGYGRAARLIDFMAEDSIVGQYNGAQAREVLISLDEWETMAGGKESASETSPATAVSTRASADKPRRRANTIRPRSESTGRKSLRTSKQKSVVDTIEEEDGNDENYDDGKLDPPFDDSEDEWDEQDQDDLADEEYEDEEGEESEFDGWDDDQDACEAADEDLEDYEEEEWDEGQEDDDVDDDQAYEYEDEDEDAEYEEPEDDDWEDEEESEWEDDAEEEWVEDEEVEDEEYADK